LKDAIADFFIFSSVKCHRLSSPKKIVSTPNLDKACPTSRPILPVPSIAILFGSSSISNSCLDVITLSERFLRK
jgi:hypothetical protein